MNDNLEISNLKELEDYIRKTVNYLIKSKRILQYRDQPISQEEISDKLIEILHSSLADEKEQYIQSEIEQLVKLNQEQIQLETSLRNLKVEGKREMSRLMQENEQLHEKQKSIQADADILTWKQSQREKNLKTQLQLKENQLFKLHSLIDSTKQIQTQLSNQVVELRAYTQKMQKRQIKTISKAKSICLSQILDSQEQLSQQVQMQQQFKIQKIQEQIFEEKKRQKQLNILAQALLNSIWTLGEGELQHPNIDSSNFTQNISEICKFIQDSLDRQKSIAVHNLEIEVQQTIPGLKLTKGEKIDDAVTRYLKEQLAKKEKECEDLLRKGEERELFLQKKLDESYHQIQNLNHSQIEEFDFSEIENMRSKWEQKKHQLDQTMKVLSSSASFE